MGDFRDAGLRIRRGAEIRSGRRGWLRGAPRATWCSRGGAEIRGGAEKGFPGRALRTGVSILSITTQMVLLVRRRDRCAWLRASAGRGDGTGSRPPWQLRALISPSVPSPRSRHT